MKMASARWNQVSTLIALVLSLSACGDDDNMGGGGSPANTVPVAEAGPDQTTGPLVGDVVVLDGSASADADGDSLAYSWTLTNVPSGSTAAITDPTLPNPTFNADKPGEY